MHFCFVLFHWEHPADASIWIEMDHLHSFIWLCSIPLDENNSLFSGFRIGGHMGHFHCLWNLSEGCNCFEDLATELSISRWMHARGRGFCGQNPERIIKSLGLLTPAFIKLSQFVLSNRCLFLSSDLPQLSPPKIKLNELHCPGWVSAGT